ncbi:MAG: Cna B-type domain-containing protein, partial [Clostridiales bacterium]|nr:Cna B-type domain-containing protein [Clostridiales bacterium]
IYQHLFSCQRYLVGYEQVDDDTWHITYRIVPSSLSNGAKEREIDEFEQELFDEILLPCMSDYEKVGAIYDWLVANCKYASHREWSVYSAWGAIIDGEAVCHGYSLALYKLLNDAGIDCRYEANVWHAWNIVNLGDCYYYCDSTWDNGKRSQFLKCWDSFADYYHTADSPWNTDEWAAQYPMAAANYNADTATDGSNVPHHVYETTASDGVTTHTCIYCGETYTGDHSEDHSILYYAAADPTCDTAGNIEYWHCLDCDKYYTDVSLSDESIVTEDKVVIPAAGHQNVNHVLAKAATKDVDGNVEYWYCSDCGGYFLDEAMTEVTHASEIVLPADANLIDVTVTIDWTDADGNPISDDLIPDSVDIELMGVEDDGTTYSISTATLTRADGWTYTFKNLSGEISYTVMEMVDGDMTLAEYDADSNTLAVTAVVYNDSFEVAGGIDDITDEDDPIAGGIDDVDDDPDNTDTAVNAPTGDTSYTYVWVIVIIVAVVVIVAAVLVMRRKRK